MDNKNIIASALSDNELARAFSELVAERWDNWDLSEFLPYLVDTCAPAVLPYLADQFDVDGLRGFEVAGTVQQQRDLIKRSIALHKFIGTPWAIREACRTVGFPVIAIIEGVTAEPNGPTSPEDWARFRVLVEADETRHITAEESRKLRVFVEFYKNERSHLIELGFYHIFREENVFRNYIAERDNLDVVTMEIKPNPVMLDPYGAEKIVHIDVSAPFVIDPLVVEWPDGSEDKLLISYNGAAGQSVICISSDQNTTGSRFVTVKIKTADGRVLGDLVIRQPLLYGNAYSRGYSNAYNNYEYFRNAYAADYSDGYNNIQPLAVQPDNIQLSDKSEDVVPIDITTRKDWEIQ